MFYPYLIHEKAYEEYILAYVWYEEREEGVGNRFMNCVEKNFNK
jgi:hypothetical protein